MHLQQQLLTYLPTVVDPAEKLSVFRCLTFVQEASKPFHRENEAGHFTASAFIVSHDGSLVVLLHHAKLSKWLQPGGHCDGNPDTFHVAQKEAEEETGLTNLQGLPSIFDVDVHWIPKRKEVPGHWHFDIRYLFQTRESSETLIQNEESNRISWIEGEELVNFTKEGSIRRMWEKSRQVHLPS